MQQTITVGKTKWIYVQEPTKETIHALAQEYHFHEMIEDALIETNAQSKLDIDSDHFFLALTFTKFLENEKRYLLNELDVIIGEDYIITTIPLQSDSLKNLFETLQKESTTAHDTYKTSPYYILYRIIDSFYDKTTRSLALSSKELLVIQDDMADKKIERDVVEDLMDHNLNKIYIKHNFLSQEDVIDDLIAHVSALHEKHLKVYFNDLRVKLTKIVSTINVLSEKTESLMSAYNTFVGIKNNDNVTRLTFVNAIFMPLTLLAGI